jgi:hypothetical protein
MITLPGYKIAFNFPVILQLRVVNTYCSPKSFRLSFSFFPSIHIHRNQSTILLFSYLLKLDSHIINIVFHYVYYSLIPCNSNLLACLLNFKFGLTHVKR